MSDDRLPNKPNNDGGSEDQTILRDQATVLRDEISRSLTGTGTASGTGSSWRSGETISAEDGVQVQRVLKQRFVLEERLGSGGMGTVFKAKDLRKVEARDSQPYIAIKVLNNDFRNHPQAFVALEREASKSQSFRHPNIVSIFDFDKDLDVPFITMELLEGDELADLLRSYPNGLPPEQAWTVIEGMVRGLEHAHDQGVVHADFKPGNVFVTNDGATKILDFGIARAMRANHEEEDTDFDPARLAALTPAYASREMLNGDNPEPRDDLFSLGVVMYMVLTGHHPFGRLPANQAAQEALQPERIKGLSRRRWRVIERCLQFNRQQRPHSANDVLEGLFGKSTWPSWALATAAAVALVSVSLTMFQEAQVIDEVKQEVRQETLVDAQLARINQLIEEPSYTSTWMQQIYSEVETLKALAPQHEAHALIQRELDQLIAARVEVSDSLETAVTRYAVASRFDQFPGAFLKLQNKLLQEMGELTQQVPDEQWLERVDDLFAISNQYFAKSSVVAAARSELAEAAQDAVSVLLANEQVELAQTTWEMVEPQIFSADGTEPTQQQLAAAVTEQAQLSARLQARNSTKRAYAAVDELLNVSCLRLDVDVLNNHIVGVRQKDAAVGTKVLHRVADRVSDCVERLSTINPDRALSLHKQARTRLGRLPQLKGKGVDPCGMQYLVGNGDQPGRSGFCTDELPNTTHGPRLVVIPGDAQNRKFAISKYEVSWKEVNEFCQQHSDCTPAEEKDLPVTGLSVSTIEQFANWLSDQTGYTYRLPTAQEWVLAAQGEPDPNRNCAIDVGGVKRGDEVLAAASGRVNSMGLVHALGNVQELVKSTTEYTAVGGTYADPIEHCLATTSREVSPAGDNRTGFRLVREVS